MLRYTAQLVRPYWGRVAIVGVALLLETVMSLAAPWPLKIVLDSVIGGHPLPEAWSRLFGATPSPLARLNAAAAFTVVVALLQAGSAYLAAYHTVSVGQWIAHDLRRSVYAHLQRLSMSYYDRQQIGPLISTITDDINAVQEFASTSLLDLLIDTLTVAGMLAIMLSLNWRFTLVAMAVTPLLWLFVSRLRGTIRQATHAMRQRQSEIVSIVQEGLVAIRVVKAFGGGRFERERLDAKSRESVDAALYARRVRSLLGPVVTCLTALGTAAVLWFGTREVLSGAMTAGALVIFLNYLGRLFRPIQSLARASTNIAQASVGLERVRAVLETDERLPSAPVPRSLGPIAGRVRFEDVTFGYAPETPVLHDVTFEATPGQLIGLVGPSGSGKSTLVALIPRFYDVTQGRVTLDGVDVRDVTVRSLRAQIAFVLQDTQLFYASVWQNLSYGRPDATRDEIVEAARAARAHDFIDALPDGYDTVIGQGGVPLSGGQRQRLGIARAIVRNAPVLVMDEPTSGLDTESERLVFEGLQQLRHGRTTFVIAHRLSTIRRADLILVLDGGHIVERGTHAELLAASGLYASLYAAQHPATDAPIEGRSL